LSGAETILSQGGSKSKLAVAKSNDKSAFLEGLKAFGGIENFVKPGDIVVLKPNISFPNPPEWGTTTSPWLVKMTAEICLEAGAKKIIVVDNPLAHNPKKNVEKSGIGKALEGMTSVEIVLSSDKQKYIAKSQNLSQLKTVSVLRVLDKANILINLPTAKAHNETAVSFGMKNLMGLIWDRQAFHLEYNLEKALAELLCYIRPNLTILDASRALLNNGPTGPGRVEILNKILISDDSVAVDSYALSLANFNNRKMTYEQVPHIKYAFEMGLGNAKMEEIDVVTAD
jgi:uncharacterized protein (DUF362 family)